MGTKQLGRVMSGVVVAIAVSLAGCASLRQDAREPALVDAMPIEADWAVSPTAAGELAIAYYDDDRSVKVRTPQALIFDSKAEYPAGSLSGLALATQGERLWWAFRPKEPMREIAVRSSDGHKLSIDAATLPLPRIALVPGDDRELMTVFWTGEKALDKSTKESSIGRAVFDAAGKQIQIEDTLPGELPNVARLADGRTLLVTNHAYSAGGKVSAWIGGEDGKAAVVSEVASGVTSVQPTGSFVSGKRMFAYWVNESGREQGENQLQLAYSDDGRDWKTSSLEWDRKGYPNQLSVAGDGAGNLVMAAMIGMLQGDGKRVNHVKLYHSRDGGASWQGPFDARASTFDYAKEEAVAVTHLSNGKFLVVWTDWRFARPTLRYSLFRPGEVQPLVHDAPFGRTQDSVARLPLKSPGNGVFESNGRINVATERPDDAFLSKSVVLMSAEVANLEKPAAEPPVPDVERLAQRVNALGKAMIDKRYADAYEFFDPFYRARVPVDKYLETQGRIEYKAYEFMERSEVQGIAANAKVKIVASVPAFTSGKARFEAAEKELESVGRWLWIDGEWYREYFSQALETRYTQF